MNLDVPTPETDAHELAGAGMVDIEFARSLERERDQARFERDRWKELAALKEVKGEANRAENNRLRSQLSRKESDEFIADHELTRAIAEQIKNPERNFNAEAAETRRGEKTGK